MKLEMDKIKCSSCNQFASPAKLKIDGVEIRGWRCKCGEEYMHPEDAEWLLLMNITKKKELTSKVSKIGNSYSIRLPKEIVDILKLKEQILKIQVGMREIKLRI